jgi:excisionase family DNA binding protein
MTRRGSPLTKPPVTAERLLLRPEEAAALLCVGKTKVYELIIQGKLPSVRFGRSRRVPLDALRAWILKQTA